MRYVAFLFFLIVPSFISAQKIKGLSFVASRDSIQDIHVAPVVKIHANYAAIMPFGFIRDLQSPEIGFDSDRQWFGEREPGVRQYAMRFKEKNIRVMIKPQIWVWRGKFTGDIEMKTEEQWKVLEDSYERFILTFANTAKAVGAHIFCIGTELEKFITSRPIYWKSLIRKIRKIYKGKLTYASNWDEFKRIDFWNQLDFIGVDAYFPLSEKKSPSVQDFEKGWEIHKIEIKNIQKKYNKPILFTEYGYRSIDFSGKEPWNSKRVEGEINLEAQANGLKAIYNMFWKEDWFVGGFLWKWFHKHDKVGGINNNRFTPQNKPAEKILQDLHKTN